MSKPMRREHDMRVAFQHFDPESLMDMPLIAAFFGGKSLPTIARWRKNPDPSRRLPEPDYRYGSVPYWKRSTIIAFRDRMMGMPAAPRGGAAKKVAESLQNHEDAQKPAGKAIETIGIGARGNHGGAR